MFDQIEPGLDTRLEKLSRIHVEYYGVEPKVVVRSPGRAEIIGNHVDYCNGQVLAGAIAQSTLVALSPRSAPGFRFYSDGFSDAPVVVSQEFVNAESFASSSEQDGSWTDLAASVLNQLLTSGIEVPSFDATITSTVTSTGGLSSSASFELGVALAAVELAGESIELEDLAKLCQKAEHGIGSMCGLLDQYAVALGEQDSLLLLDFQNNSSSIVSSDLGDNSFLVLFDAVVSRNLGETGYLARRQACEAGLKVLNEANGTKHTSLREVSLSELEAGESAVLASHVLAEISGETVYKRLRHIITEMQRVDKAVLALEAGESNYFGQLMNEAGLSALDDYDLDEDTPELTHLVASARETSGVLGARNMGGGFSSVTLALVEDAKIDSASESIANSYKHQFGGDLEFVRFTPSAGVQRIV